MRSATFRNIAIGTLALAAAYHLGASSSQAQSGSVPAFHIASNGNPFVSCPNGDVWRDILGGSWEYMGNALSGRPGRTIIGMTGAGSYFLVLLDDGELLANNGALTWTPAGSPPCATPTPSQTESLGSVKSRYSR